MENNDYTISQIKKEFYRFRNGLLAESLKKLPDAKKIIFGLNVPQFMELSQKFPKDFNLAMQLWMDKDCRESRLLSLYLLPVTLVDTDTAQKLILEVENAEEAEFLAFRILRKIKNAREIYSIITRAEELKGPPAYCITMFKKNLDQI